MTKSLCKHYGSFDLDDFIDSIRCDWDNKLITYDSNDYMFDMERGRKGEPTLWYLVDALEFMTVRHPRRMAGPFSSLDELLAAPILDGKSIVERYGELLTADLVSVVDGEDA